LVRTKLRLEYLYAVDVFYALAAGTIFASATRIARDRAAPSGQRRDACSHRGIVALDSAREDSMTMQHNIQVSVGDHVFLDGAGEEIGAVREVERDHLVVYIEAAGDFILRGPEIRAVHYGKLVLAPDRLEPRLLAAARAAHERENENENENESE
jgi:hypothetical protein